MMKFRVENHLYARHSKKGRKSRRDNGIIIDRRPSETKKRITALLQESFQEAGLKKLKLFKWADAEGTRGDCRRVIYRRIWNSSSAIENARDIRIHYILLDIWREGREGSQTPFIIETHKIIKLIKSFVRYIISRHLAISRKRWKNSPTPQKDNDR